jgi:4-hydroxybenzoate polyprenyltransferase
MSAPPQDPGSAAPARHAGRGLLALCRASNLPTVWMNVLTAVVLSGGDGFSALTLLLVASLSGFYCGGMCLNDLFDRVHDAEHQPFRPIPSGRVSVGEARGTAALLLGAGSVLLAFTPHPDALVPGLILLATITAYNRLHKQHAWTVLLMAACRTLVFVVCGWAASGTVSALVLGAGLIQFGWTLFVTVVARAENTRPTRFEFPVIPLLIAAMGVVDGLFLAVAVSPIWLAAGVGAAILTLLGQRVVRGD